MKKIFKAFFLVIFLLLFSALVASCSQQVKNRDLLEAERLLWQKNDSVALLLEAAESAHLSAADKQLAVLLRSFFRYGGDKPIDIEPLSQSIAFFAENGAWSRAGLGYYLRGAELVRAAQNDSAIVDLKRAEKALQQADTVADMLWGHLYYTEGTVFEQEEMNEVAFVCYQKALPYFQRCDVLYAISTFCALGRVTNHRPMRYFQKALDLADSVCDQPDLHTIVAGSIVGNAQQMPYSDLTIDFYRKLAPKYPYYNALLAEVFLGRDELDSCKRYINLLAVAGAQDYKISFLQALYLNRSGQSSEAFAVLGRAYAQLERQQYNKNRLETYKILHRFDVSEEREKSQFLTAKMAQQRAVLLAALFAVLFVLSVVVGFCIVFVQKNRAQRRRIIAEQEKELNLLRFRIECTIKMNVDTNLGKYTLEQLPANIRDIVRQTTYCGNRWKVLRDELSAVYGRFFAVLRKNYPKLTDKDILIACLLGLKFKNREIILLLWMNENTFYRRRDLLKERMNLPDPKTLDETCQSLMVAAFSGRRRR